MRLQQFTTRIPKYLFGATTPHKTGDFSSFIANDVGLIEPYGKPPVIVCFFNAHHRGIWAQLEDVVARMSEKVWDAQRALQLWSKFETCSTTVYNCEYRSP